MHTFIAIIVAIVLFVLFVRIDSRWNWVFNRVMLWGAGLGLFIGFGVADLVNTAHHKGPGMVEYGGDEPGTGGQISSDIGYDKVSESEYKRHGYVDTGFALLIGVIVWIEVAKWAKNNYPKKVSDKTNDQQEPPKPL
jgi:hypothetical protein